MIINYEFIYANEIIKCEFNINDVKLSIIQNHLENYIELLCLNKTLISNHIKNFKDIIKIKIYNENFSREFNDLYGIFYKTTFENELKEILHVKFKEM